jgi:hypothetical protein
MKQWVNALLLANSKSFVEACFILPEPEMAMLQTRP